MCMIAYNSLIHLVTTAKVDGYFMFRQNIKSLQIQNTETSICHIESKNTVSTET